VAWFYFYAYIGKVQDEIKIKAHLFSALDFSLSSHAFTLENLFSFSISARAISVHHRIFASVIC